MLLTQLREFMAGTELQRTFTAIKAHSIDDIVAFRTELIYLRDAMLVSFAITGDTATVWKSNPSLQGGYEAPTKHTEINTPAFAVGDPVIYEGKTYTFPGYVVGVTTDGQYVVQAVGTPEGWYKGMKHLYGHSQLKPWRNPNE